MKSCWVLVILILLITPFFSGCIYNQDSSGSEGIQQAKLFYDAGKYNESLAIYENLTIKHPADASRMDLEEERSFSKPAGIAMHWHRLILH